jgi:hypothetical protein
MRTVLVLSGLCALVLAQSPAVESCCMVPATYKGTISQSAQEAVLFHHHGREELILKINYKISGKTLPDRFAWVVTVPNEPDDYAVADKTLFEDMFKWANPLTEITRPTLGWIKKSAEGGVILGKPVNVGPYAIQPVRALGKEALEGLNNWLHKNGFPTEDPRHMEYFVENQFTFLCVKVSPQKNGEAVASQGGVPPLHLSFKSPNPYYPLRFSSRQGVFDVNLYVLTKKEFDYKKSGDTLKRINWAASYLKRNVLVESRTFPESLKKVYAKSKFKDDTGRWYLNMLRTRQTNKDNAIARWTEDIFFKTRG